ncbi:fibronectin type III-like domain-contianing protein [Gemmiger formicilis]|uniref:fibronectin type III-like domain-contianing protein n=1 Tax=Gemmiger formicilis TaxID=745368 RepID=UPI003521EE72
MTLTVTNTGNRAGAEIVQLYVAKPDAKVFRPAQELKGFAKVQLAPGESKTVTIALDDKAFRYWNTKTDSWEVEGGSYELRVGASSADIRLTAVVEVAGTEAPNPYAGKSLPHYDSGKVQSVTRCRVGDPAGLPHPGGQGPHRPQHDAGRAEPQPQPAWAGWSGWCCTPC